jgi:transaldolase
MGPQQPDLSSQEILPPNHDTAPSKLTQLRTMTRVVADTADYAAVQRLRPMDCTTNPTLVLRFIQDAAYEKMVHDNLEWGKKQNAPKNAVVEAVSDRLIVGCGAQLAPLVPGSISTEVDADYSFSTTATCEKARAFIAEYKTKGIDQDRILIKIAATWEGMQAADILQKEGINCNLTLVFCMAQAIVCAQAGAYLISPFVGRITDWHKARNEGPFTSETDPGVNSVRQIYEFYKTHGIGTIVMGASFRSVEQVEALAGCDRLTISPALLDSLDADHQPLQHQLTCPDIPLKSFSPLTEERFRFLLNENAMATEKLAEGIRLFTKDLYALRTLVYKLLAY